MLKTFIATDCLLIPGWCGAAGALDVGSKMKGHHFDICQGTGPVAEFLAGYNILQSVLVEYGCWNFRITFSLF